MGSRWSGAVLTGGASRRMGRDKASIEIDGVGMADRALAALRAAGATDVARIGDGVADLHPGEGPLGGVLTALDWSAEQLIAVVPCDLLAPDAASLRLLVDGLLASDALVAVPDLDRPLPLVARAAAEIPLRGAFDRGERSLRRALAGVSVVEVPLPDAATADADTPDELPPDAR